MTNTIFDQQEYNIDVPINEGTKNIPGFKETVRYAPRYSNNPKKPRKKTTLISRFFTNLSRYGLSYEEDVVKNMKAIPADKSLLPKPEQLYYGDLFAQMTGFQKTQAEKNFFDKDFAPKRDALKKLALAPELEDILDTMSNEAVVFDSEHTYFAEPYIEELELNAVKKSFRKKITTSMSDNYKRIYKMLNMRVEAWGLFKRWLVEGILAWEIVWDDLEKPTKIIGLTSLDAATLTRKIIDNKIYWVQFAGVQGRERTLRDAQIVYIEYDEGARLKRTSYLERLIRPYNIYRIIEQAQIIWTVTNASFKTAFTIPIKGMNQARGTQTVSSAMNQFRENIQFDIESGELSINGKSNMQFNKEYWFPESDSGKPEIETLGGDGPDLNDNDQLKYFKNQLYRMSKIPLNRFDQESSESWFGTDATSVTRTEIDFGRFVDRLRNTFSQILIKPLMLQIACDIPELIDNMQILEALYLKWNSYNLFEEMMEIELMTKRMEFVSSAKDSLIDMDAEGNEIKFFSSEWLTRKYLGLSDADLKMNKQLKQEEIANMCLAGGEDNYSDKDAPIKTDDPDGDDEIEDDLNIVNS